jgi:ferredoxin-type protein NapH
MNNRNITSSEKNDLERPDNINRVFSIFVVLQCVGMAIFAWKLNGYLHYFMTFTVVMFSIIAGIYIRHKVPKKHKGWGRKASQLIIGGFILVYWGLIRRENMQIEMFFFYLFSGLYSGAVIVYLAAHIVGPLIYGRAFCGWSCWTAMILDLLPWDKSTGRIKNLGFFRYLHFLISFVMVLTLYKAFNVTFKSEGTMAEFYWMLAGNLLYYFVAIGMAVYMKENRAFCKYACPIPVVQKITARFALFKIRLDPNKCIECGLCEKVCPMDIKLVDYMRKGQRILSLECVSDVSCANVCPTNAIDYSLGFDIAKKEDLIMRGETRTFNPRKRADGQV